MPNRRVALVTEQRWPELIPDDRPLLQAFGAEELSGVPIVWTDKHVNWSFFDAVVIRTPWDYHRRFTDFEEFINRLERANIPLWNPPAALRWNSRKSYLEELESRGVPTIPTAWLPAGSPPLLSALANQRGWDEVVVKPEVSAGGRDTWRCKRDDLPALEEQLAPKLKKANYLMQAFVPEVTTEGEISLIFFNGEFSHAVRKLPAPGEFLIHEEHGGRVERHRAPADLARWASGVLYFVESPLLYARVDLIEGSDGPVLVELEVLEPQLFLRHGNDAFERFAAAISSRLG